MKSTFEIVFLILLLLPHQRGASAYINGKFMKDSFVPISQTEEVPNYGIVSWVAIGGGKQTQLHSVSFVPQQGFVYLRNLFSSQLGVGPSRIHIMASSGQIIQDESTLQSYVKWCIQEKTPMMFVVRVTSF